MTCEKCVLRGSRKCKNCGSLKDAGGVAIRRKLICYFCGKPVQEEIQLAVIDNQVIEAHALCLIYEKKRQKMLKETIKKTGVTTWLCECGANNRIGIENCMVCGASKPAAGNGKKLAGAAAKAVAQKTKQLEHKHPAKAVAKTQEKKTAPKKTQHAPKVEGGLITIKCVDCGAKREIKPQDAFQVKRCTSCQKIYRLEKRKLARQKKHVKKGNKAAASKTTRR